jgi:hypothetical protein
MVVGLLQVLLANFTASTKPALQSLGDDQRPETSGELATAFTDVTRDREILCKAVTGILILMLKWFRVSRITLSDESDFRRIEI